MKKNSANQARISPAARILILIVMLGGLLAAGSAFLRHERYVARQEYLYRYYVTTNEWRPRVRTAYDALGPLMDEFERIDPQNFDRASAKALGEKLRNASKAARKIEGANCLDSNGQWQDFSDEISHLLAGDALILGQLIDVSELDQRPSARLTAAGLAAGADEAKTGARGASAVTLFEMLRKRNESLDDATLKAKAIGVIEQMMRESKQGREELRRDINGPEVVPAGLNLAYASRLPWRDEN